ncbi:MAG TPA: hypothetical protein PLD59_11195 [Tepidisphaeraceae bacterium]|nr:hypothetical protein [Tepidisphaeraceae bacterium]
MRFRVTGTNHSTGARMTLEFEAPAKAAAEHKARGAGMDVQHVAEVHDGPPVERKRTTHRGDHGGDVESVAGFHPVLKTLLILAIIVLASWIVWPYVRGFFS